MGDVRPIVRREPPSTTPRRVDSRRGPRRSADDRRRRAHHLREPGDGRAVRRHARGCRAVHRLRRARRGRRRGVPQAPRHPGDGGRGRPRPRLPPRPARRRGDVGPGAALTDPGHRRRGAGVALPGHRPQRAARAARGPTQARGPVRRGSGDRPHRQLGARPAHQRGHLVSGGVPGVRARPGGGPSDRRAVLRPPACRGARRGDGVVPRDARRRRGPRRRAPARRRPAVDVAAHPWRGRGRRRRGTGAGRRHAAGHHQGEGAGPGSGVPERPLGSGQRGEHPPGRPVRVRRRGASVRALARRARDHAPPRRRRPRRPGQPALHRSRPRPRPAGRCGVPRARARGGGSPRHPAAARPARVDAGGGAGVRPRPARHRDRVRHPGDAPAERLGPRGLPPDARAARPSGGAGADRPRAVGRPRRGSRRLPREVGVPGHDEPRDPHPAQRRDRAERAAAAHRAHRPPAAAGLRHRPGRVAPCSRS